MKVRSPRGGGGAAAWRELAAGEGLLWCPEGAPTYAAYLQALAEGRVRPDERVVLFNCASGLKYPMPEAGTPLKLGSAIDRQKLTQNRGYCRCRNPALGHRD